MDEEIRKGLKQLFGPKSQWKTPEQGQAMKKIMRMQGAESLIVVLPTGGGKSVLFMLPALLTTDTTIVVVPFTALMDDLVERACESGVDCIQWRAESHEEGEVATRVAQLVVVSADVVNRSKFTRYVEGLRSRGVLGRIFVDECHTIIMDVGYRRELENLRGLHRYECPTVWLTATLPVKMEGWFRQCSLTTEAEIIRAMTRKQNIRYRMVELKGQRQQVKDEVVRVVTSRTPKMQGDDKGVVYCRSKIACEELAEKLGCDFYHSGITDKRRRKQVLEEWSTGKSSRWITATTGLGTGIDIPGIVVVVHMEAPWGLVDFVQQTGRGGRQAGTTVDSVIVMGGVEG